MNEFLTIKSNEKANILAGPDCSLSNYEYRGDFLRGSDKKHFGPKVLHSKSWGLTNGWQGYLKLAKDLHDVIAPEMTKKEFKHFKTVLAM